MQPIVKKTIALFVVAVLMVMAYYGSYLPLQKSYLFIDSLKEGSTAVSLEEFERIISKPLDAPSPIGQEELVRNIAGSVLNVIGARGENIDLTEQLLNYLNSYFDPLIERGTGMSFTQNLYILGSINSTALQKTHQVRFLDKAKSYMEQGLKLSPGRPQFLYALFNLYRVEGNVAKVKEVGEKILEQWPKDEGTRQGLAAFLKDNSNKK